MSHSTAARPSVLVVHRDLEFHRAVTGHLRKAGVACAEARNRREALAILAVMRFDFVLYDREDSLPDDLGERLQHSHPKVTSIVVGSEEDSASSLQDNPERLLQLIRAA